MVSGASDKQPAKDIEAAIEKLPAKTGMFSNYLVLRNGVVKCEKLGIGDTLKAWFGSGDAKLTGIAKAMKERTDISRQAQERFQTAVASFLDKQLTKIAKIKDPNQRAQQAATLIESFAPWQLAKSGGTIKGLIEAATIAGKFEYALNLYKTMPAGEEKLSALDTLLRAAITDPKKKQHVELLVKEFYASRPDPTTIRNLLRWAIGKDEEALKAKGKKEETPKTKDKKGVAPKTDKEEETSTDLLVKHFPPHRFLGLALVPDNGLDHNKKPVDAVASGIAKMIKETPSGVAKLMQDICGDDPIAQLAFLVRLASKENETAVKQCIVTLPPERRQNLREKLLLPKITALQQQAQKKAADKRAQQPSGIEKVTPDAIISDADLATLSRVYNLLPFGR